MDGTEIIAAMKTLTVPQLEVMVARIGNRPASRILSTFECKNVVF